MPQNPSTLRLRNGRPYLVEVDTVSSTSQSGGFRSESANFTTDGTYHNSVDTSGGAVTVTLSSADATEGSILSFKHNGTNTLTIDTEGSETIDGNSSVDLVADDESVTFIYNSQNTDWEVVY